MILKVFSNPGDSASISSRQVPVYLGPNKSEQLAGDDLEESVLQSKGIQWVGNFQLDIVFPFAG